MKIDIAAQRAIRLESRPPSSAGVIALIVAIPRELHGGALVDKGLPTIHPAPHGNESETPRVVAAEFDERRADQIQGITAQESEASIRHLPMRLALRPPVVTVRPDECVPVTT